MSTQLYTYVSKTELQSMLDTFYHCIDITIQVIDANGHFLERSGDISVFYTLLQKYLPLNETHEKLYISASKKAITLGEPYIFSSPIELNHIIYPLITNKTTLGSIVIGPFLMDEPDSLLLSNITQRYTIPTKEVLELYDESKHLPIIPPTTVRHVGHLVHYMFSNLISSGKEELRKNNQKLLQQSRINESIQRYKTTIIEDKSSYSYEQEKLLLDRVKHGDIKNAHAILNDLLGYVLFSQGNSFEITKTRSLELCSLLSRAAIENGAPTDSVLKLNNLFLQNLQEIKTVETLCFKLQEIVETFSESVFNYIPSKNNEIIKTAMQFISQHFNDSLNLNTIANHVHLHPAYFSSIFKQSTGSTFKEYLNMVRIEESKRLLSNTNISIIEIAIATGFEDQSYFTKVFKKYTGITPKQYR